ncbi:MAG: hypothetical protein AAGB51_04350 [Planctomycetota bacterium]
MMQIQLIAAFISGLLIQPGATLEARLASLSSTQPSGYLLLAEEVADEPTGPEDLALARRLYVLAFELDRTSANPEGVAASACLGLAELASGEQERRWLRSLASLVDPRYSPDALDSDINGMDTRASLRAATALGLIRAGDGPAARRALGEPGVRDMLSRREPLLNPSEGGLYGLLRDAEVWPDGACGGDRTIRLPEAQGGGHRLCPVCGGDPGRRLTRPELLAQLRTEWVLLDVEGDGWGAQAMIDPAPLIDADPTSLLERYGINPSESVYRDGAWQRP